MDNKLADCCLCIGKDWFRYRVGAIIVCDGYALFAYSEEDKHYYSVGGGVHIGESSEAAVLREVYEETGEHFQIERPLCLIENFFRGTGTLGGLDCHVIEYYYLMKPVAGGMQEYDVGSITGGGQSEKMCWLPIDKLDEYDVRPITVKMLAKDPPEHFVSIVNEEYK